MVKRSDIASALDRLCVAMKRFGSASFEEEYPSSLVDMRVWEWPQGVGLYGLWKRFERTQDPVELAWLEQWFDMRLAHDAPAVERNVNTTAPMLALTFLYGKTGKRIYLNAINGWVEWMEKDLIRTGDGAFQHMITGNPNSGQILIDTIFMALLFLARASLLLGRRDLACEVEYQVMIHTKYLFDPHSDLFMHGWDFSRRHNYGGVLWARGNAWYNAGIMELLEMDILSPAVRRYLLVLYRNQCEQIVRLQDESGLWHTVLDNSSSYLEASASAGFIYGIAKGVRNGVLDADVYAPVIGKSASGLLSLIGSDGIVGQVSYGTPVGESEDFYTNIPIQPMTYGQALAILALQELSDPFWAAYLA